MDLQTAVAISMLGLSRARVCSAFRELRQHDPDSSLEALAEALLVPEPEQRELIDEARSRADAALSLGASAGLDVVPWFDVRYPALLNCVTDPPPVLWTLGNPAVLGRPAVAVVGSRAATTYALDVGHRLGGELARRGVVVVSGLARGVDSAAHRGCLEDGPTVAVLGSGLDRVYPPEHAESRSKYCKTRSCRKRARPRCGAASRELPAEKSNHQWDLTGGCRRRSVREEWIAHNRQVRHGAGARCHGGPGKHSDRP